MAANVKNRRSNNTPGGGKDSVHSRRQTGIGGLTARILRCVCVCV